MIKNVTDLDVQEKVVLVRVDFNVPMNNQIITDDSRVKAALPTIKYLIEQKAKIVLFSHFGRVAKEEDLKSKTLNPVASLLGKLIEGHAVHFVNDIEGQELEEAIANLKPSEVLLVENTRFADIMDSNGQLNLKANRESGNDQALGLYWAHLGDVFINDAFGTIHRAHASNCGIAASMKEVGIGFLVQKELTNLGKIVQHPEQPFVGIIGGAKVSDKIGIIDSLLKHTDKLIIAGGMAYTFKAAQNKHIGDSLVEQDKIALAQEYLAQYKDKIILPLDFGESKTFENSEPRYTITDEIDAKYMGLDIGPRSVKYFKEIIAQAKTVFWNGPVGVFEFANYAKGTVEICQAIAALKNAFTVIGGGDSAAAAVQLGFASVFSHISTGGGAALDFVAGKPLPALNILDK